MGHNKAAANDRTFVVVGDDFCGMLKIRDGKVIRTDAEIKIMLHWPLTRVVSYCHGHGYDITIYKRKRDHTVKHHAGQFQKGRTSRHPNHRYKSRKAA